jgi:MFS family permease
VATIGFLVLTKLPASGGYSPLLAAVMLVGFGSAGTAFGTMVTASHGVADGDQGLVGGVINTSRQIGAAIGAALLPAVAVAADHGNRAADAGGDRAAMLAGALAAAIAFTVALGSVLDTARSCGTPEPHPGPRPLSRAQPSRLAGRGRTEPDLGRCARPDSRERASRASDGPFRCINLFCDRTNISSVTEIEVE